MAFWGIELKPEKPYVHESDESRRGLHLSQATLGTGSSTKKSIVQCKVGDKDPVFLCALLPEKIESCALNLEFEEDEDVEFSILGPRSVHLTGFYQHAGDSDEQEDGDRDIYGYDRGEDESDQSSDYDTEDEYDDILMDEDDDDDEDEDEFGMFPPSPRPNSGVVIEEIVDDEKPANGNASHKRPKKKKLPSGSDGKDASKMQLVVKRASTPVLESEDEDGFPITRATQSGGKMQSGQEEKTDRDADQDGEVKKFKDDNGATHLKRKSDATEQDGQKERQGDEQNASVVPSTEATGMKKKRKKRKTKAEKTLDGGENSAAENFEERFGVNNNRDIGVADSAPDNTSTQPSSVEEQSEVKEKEKKKKKNKNKTSGSITRGEEEKSAQLSAEKTDSNKKKNEQKAQVPSKTKTRTYGNGLVVEELSMGKPDGKRASPGNRVSVRYIGKLKKNGDIFDSNTSGKPFKFRLGIGQVIKGWDVGVEGMRIGDKRRLTIPPSMGYGSKGIGKIPANAWLVFDVELVDVQ